MKNTVYYLPGMGGRIDTGLGKGILDRGFQVVGRETRDNFKNLPFQGQIDAVAADLQEHFWYEGSIVIANSFGCYLFLHAQLKLAPFPGKAVILSPIIGPSKNNEVQMGFYPPRADVLHKAAVDGTFPCPLNAEIHVGSEDWQSGSAGVVEFANAVGLPVNVADGLGHMLGTDYVGNILDRTLLQK